MCTFVSGTHRKIIMSARTFNPAKNPNAPVGVKASRIFGNVRPKTAAQKRHVATAQPIPTSLWDWDLVSESDMGCWVEAIPEERLLQSK
jgi:hypothetical protein